MVSILHNLETELSSNIFDIAIRMIAQQIDNFFIYSMILNTKFSSGGTIQFQFDMTRNLFALFGQYVRRPESLFKKYVTTTPGFQTLENILKFVLFYV